MKAKEILQALKSINPETEVTITTNSGTKRIARVVTMGYNDSATIEAED